MISGGSTSEGKFYFPDRYNLDEKKKSASHEMITDEHMRKVLEQPQFFSFLLLEILPFPVLYSVINCNSHISFQTSEGLWNELFLQKMIEKLNEPLDSDESTSLQQTHSEPNLAKKK